jgi:hypothetical protein
MKTPERTAGYFPNTSTAGARGQRNAKWSGLAGATAFLAWWMGFSSRLRQTTDHVPPNGSGEFQERTSAARSFDVRRGTSS